MAHPFLERLRYGPILCDGAMGTLLYQRGIPYERCFDEVSLSKPDVVSQIHRDYIAAGAEVIETNTFGANRFRLATHGLEDRVVKVNRAGVKVARDAREISGKPVFVAGSIGPVGQPLTPVGRITPQQAFDAFKEQAEGLLEGGVDLFIVETFSDLTEITQAVKAVRSVCDLPIVAQMSFTEEGATLAGQSPEAVAQALEALGVDMLGTNCSVGPQALLDVLLAMRRTTKRPLSIQPNAGLPRLVEGRWFYYTSPTYFAEYAQKFLEAGATLVGGCCGTTPEHIHAMAQILKRFRATATEVHPAPEAPRVQVVEKPEPLPAFEASHFAQKLGKKFVVSVELDPPRGINPEKLLKGAELMEKHGVDAINIGDSPMARVRMSCIAIGVLIQKRVKNIDIILHWTTRDRNLMGLQSDLIGAHALGIRNILAITGDPPTIGDYPHATGVYDVDSIGLIQVIARLNTGVDWAGNSIGSPTALTIGCGVNPTAEDMAKEVERYKKKIEGGAQFAFTQPLYELSILEEFLDRTHDCRIPVLLGLLPLQSTRHTEFLHNEVPGITIPADIRKRMAEAGHNGAQEGIAMCRDLLEKAKDMVSGAYLMPSFGRYETVLEVVKGFLTKTQVVT